ncbi:MAG: geranylgeranylglyceryl/heptaprenylglyceryl phosphate synthase [Bacteroidia bacterium]|nr:geranylgeranylglyceryl/heptaprenylglyceryl phosphate synthase [Bacteroidia bacterium]MCX7763794.1 geranylgeranylglyceryl/heptaprenylglyceryl phosphate synthase [Bacteroidia bacterium]MDW8056923.1 geranylgeranylglyceryl/heptaprenylglyceryl phosphate synthase [Bacteroidia bacterium]
MTILHAWQEAPPQPLWLIDPDKLSMDTYPLAAEAYLEAGGRWALVGGSFFSFTHITHWCAEARKTAPLPLILFPGSTFHLTPAVDAMLFLFLASGRNPHYLIGAHVEAAPFLYRWGGEVIPTTYILVGDSVRTVHYVSQTLPIPSDKPELVQATALAGWYLGQKLIYIDAGSGAPRPPSGEFIQAVRSVVPLPLIVGGGIQEPQEAADLFDHGANFVVIGNAAEKSAFSRSFWEEFFSICRV